MQIELFIDCIPQYCGSSGCGSGSSGIGSGGAVDGCGVVLQLTKVDFLCSIINSFREMHVRYTFLELIRYFLTPA